MMVRATAFGLAFVGILASDCTIASIAMASDLGTLVGPRPYSPRTVDMYGRVLAVQSLQDHLTVVSFVSVGCSILCVTRTMDLEKLARDLPRSLRGRVVFLALDTDPAVDDPGRLRTFAEGLLGPEPHMRFLAADAVTSRLVKEEFRYPKSFSDPPSTVLLFDRRGQIAMSYGGAPLDAPRLQRDLAVLDLFTQGLGHPLAGAEYTR